MAVYLITYDLVAPGRHYQKVIDAIKGCGNWAHPTESTWLVETNLNSVQIRDRIKVAGDGNDKILVIKATNDAAGFNLLPDVWNWIQAKL